MVADFAVDMPGDYRTLRPEQEVDAGARITTEAFEVTLTFGDDELGVMIPLQEGLRAPLEYGSGGVATVVDNLDCLGDSGLDCVGVDRIVEDGLTPYYVAAAFGAEFFKEYPVTDDLTGVVTEDQNLLGVLELFQKFSNCAAVKCGVGGTAQ